MPWQKAGCPDAGAGGGGRGYSLGVSADWALGILKEMAPVWLRGEVLLGAVLEELAWAPILSPRDSPKQENGFPLRPLLVPPRTVPAPCQQLPYSQNMLTRVLVQDCQQHSSVFNQGLGFFDSVGLIPGLGRSSGEGDGNPLPYSYLENPMDGEACWATVHGVTKTRTRLSN